MPKKGSIEVLWANHERKDAHRLDDSRERWRLKYEEINREDSSLTSDIHAHLSSELFSLSDLLAIFSTQNFSHFDTSDNAHQWRMKLGVLRVALQERLRVVNEEWNYKDFPLRHRKRLIAERELLKIELEFIQAAQREVKHAIQNRSWDVKTPSPRKLKQEKRRAATSEILAAAEANEDPAMGMVALAFTLLIELKDQHGYEYTDDQFNTVSGIRAFLEKNAKRAQSDVVKSNNENETAESED